MRLLIRLGNFLKRTLGICCFLQPSGNRLLRSLMEPAAHVPDELECLSVVKSEQQRTKVAAAPARLSPSAHHRVERLRRLDLHPLCASQTRIAAIGALADDSLEPLLPG